MRSIITAARDPEVRLAEADFAARGLRRRLRSARRLNLALAALAACAVLWGAFA